MIFRLNQGGIQKILKKNVYYEKWSDKKFVQYEVKIKGESYLNTRWLGEMEVRKMMVNQYEGRKDERGVDEFDRQEKKEIIEENNNGICSKQKIKLNNNIINYSNPTSKQQQQEQQRSHIPILVREYNINPLQTLKSKSKTLRISINTKQKKQQNHFVYNDRVHEILSQMHYMQEKVYDNKVIDEKTSCQQRSTKVIEMNLGSNIKVDNYDRQEGNNYNSNLQQKKEQQQEYLINYLYPRMSQLKAMQLLKHKNVLIKIWMRVRWQDGTVSKVKMNYLQQYQPQLMQKYKDNRTIYWQMWKIHNSKINNINNTHDKTQSNNYNTTTTIIPVGKHEQHQQHYHHKQHNDKQEQTNQETSESINNQCLYIIDSAQKNNNKSLLMKRSLSSQQQQDKVKKQVKKSTTPNTTTPKKESINQQALQQSRSRLLLKEYLPQSQAQTQINNNNNEKKVQRTNGMIMGKKSVNVNLSVYQLRKANINKDQPPINNQKKREININEHIKVVSRQKSPTKQTQNITKLQSLQQSQIGQQQKLLSHIMNNNSLLYKKDKPQSVNKNIVIKKSIQVIVIDDD